MRIVITYQHRGDIRYLELIEMAFASARRLGYETVLVGNKNIAGDIFLKFAAEEEEHLMNWILAAQLAYINSPIFSCDSVFFSPDALITKPLSPIFTMNFDAAFTERDNKKWPINNGVIFLKPENKAALAELWEEALLTCKSYSLDVQKWYGDQLALWDVWVNKTHCTLDLRNILIPCARYNATPEKGDGLDRKIVDVAYIIHLKGNRKNTMKKYWELICEKD